MRLYKYDFVRAVAILFVVAVHSLYFVDQSNSAFFGFIGRYKRYFLPAMHYSSFFQANSTCAKEPMMQALKSTITVRSETSCYQL